MPKVVELPFHQSVTALAVAWSAVCLGLLLCLKMRVFPAGLKFFSTACDVLFLTGILMAADGPRSPLVIGYFLVIVVSTLRFSLPLVRFATLGSMAGYLWLLAYARWFTDRDLHVPRYQQAIFLLGLALAGIVLGQAIRRVEGLARDYAARLDSRKGDQPSARRPVLPRWFAPSVRPSVGREARNAGSAVTRSAPMRLPREGWVCPKRPLMATAVDEPAGSAGSRAEYQSACGFNSAFRRYCC